MLLLIVILLCCASACIVDVNVCDVFITHYSLFVESTIYHHRFETGKLLHELVSSSEKN